jgi:pilus assembly protein FimV
LDAEIPLVLSGADSLSDVRVSLASPEAFTKAGLERHYFLTKLQFSPVQTADGHYVIKVSSRDVMREPFLNFLVEVNSPQGRVVREFTALLDPPASMQGEAVAETERAVMERPRRYERVAEISRSGDYAPPVRRSAQRTIGATPQAPAPRPAPALPPASEDQLTNEAYGPIRRDENLWGIAKALNSDSALTHEQMVMGLYRANPQAFSRGINSLKAGATLRLPTREFIAQLSPQQARVEYARQQGWNVSRMAGAAPQLMEGEGPQSQLKLLAPSDSKGQGAGSQTGGKGRGDLALEVAETAKQENDELRSRLAQLEQKLSEMQRKLAIKDEEIASLQTQPHSATPPAQPVEPPAQKPVATPQPATPTAQATPTTPPEPTQVTPPPPQPTAAQPTPPPTSAPLPTSVAPSTAAAPRPTPPPKPVPAPRPAAAPPAAEENWMTDPTYLGIAGGAALLGITALLIRRRRNAIIAETESILIAAERASRQASLGGGAQFSAMRPSAEPAVEPIAAPKSSFLSEFTPSDFDTLGTETDEVDPISEADVYLAYGRYKQAEELIRHAISQHPERDECKLKLLEIYHTTENRAAFENYAKELKAQHKDRQPEFWNKVVEMGRELAPGSALFQGSGASSAASATPKAIEKSLDPTMGLGSLDLSDDLIDDLKRFEIEFSEPTFPGDGDTDLASLDFGSSADELDSPVVKPAEPDRFAALDFDLASLGIGKSTPAAPAAAKEPPKPEPPPSEFDNLLDFNFDSLAPSPQAPPPAEETYEEQADKTIDDILRDLTDSLKQDEPEPTPTPTPAPPAEPEPRPASSDLSLSGLGFDLSLFEQTNLGVAETDEPEAAELPEESSDLYAGLTDMDQVETKLDLAKAYADMEDEESASEILQDILATGNDKQKAEARQLLAKMGKADAA